MAYLNFKEGIGLVVKAVSQSTLAGDVEMLNDGRLYLHNGTTNSGILTIAHAAQGASRVQNKDLDTTNTRFVDGADTTKRLVLNIAGATTGATLTLLSSPTTNRTITIPDATDTVVLLAASQTLTNKVLSGNTAATLISGSGTLTLNTSGNMTVPNGTSTLVSLTNTQTLTNKTLTAPSIDAITGTGGSLTVTAVSGGMSLLNNTELRLVESGGANYVGIRAAASMSADYSITLPAASPTANTSLVFDGANYVWGQAGGWNVSSSTSLAGGGTVSISLTQGQQVYTVSSSGGAVTLSNTPFGASAPTNGTVVRLIGISDTNVVSLTDADVSRGARLKGNITLTSGDILELQYISSADRWFETFRNK